MRRIALLLLVALTASAGPRQLRLDRKDRRDRRDDRTTGISCPGGLLGKCRSSNGSAGLTVTNPIPSAALYWCVSARIKPNTAFNSPAGTRAVLQGGLTAIGGTNTWLAYFSGGAPELRIWDAAGNFKGASTSATAQMSIETLSYCNNNGATSIWFDGVKQTVADSGGTGTGIVTTQPSVIRIGESGGGTNLVDAQMTEICIAGPVASPPGGADPRANISPVCKQFTNRCLFGKSCTFLEPLAGSTKVDCIGDSITAGGANGNVAPTWPQRLHGWLNEGYAVTNSGVAGDKTADMLTRWNGGISAGGYGYVVVMGGVNDALGGVALATIESNLQSIYDSAHTASMKVIALTVTPCGGWSGCDAGVLQKISDTNTWIASYVAANPTNTKLVDTNAMLRDPNDSTKLFAPYDSGDHLHPGQTGADQIAAAVYRTFP